MLWGKKKKVFQNTSFWLPKLQASPCIEEGSVFLLWDPGSWLAMEAGLDLEITKDENSVASH